MVHVTNLPPVRPPTLPSPTAARTCSCAQKPGGCSTPSACRRSTPSTCRLTDLRGRDEKDRTCGHYGGEKAGQHGGVWRRLCRRERESGACCEGVEEERCEQTDAVRFQFSIANLSRRSAELGSFPLFVVAGLVFEAVHLAILHLLRVLKVPFHLPVANVLAGEAVCLCS